MAGCLLATPAIAQPTPDEVAEVKVDLYAAYQDGLNAAEKRGGNNVEFDNLGPIKKREIGLWLVTSLSIGMCAPHLPDGLYQRWEAMLQTIMGPLGEMALPFQLSAEDHAKKSRQKGAQMMAESDLDYQGRVNFCAIEMEAVSQILDEIAPF